MIRWWTRRQVRRNAASWYARMAEPASTEEVAAFETWLARSQEHPRAYAELEAIMRAAGSRPAVPQRFARPHSALRPALALLLAAITLVTVVVLAQSAPAPAFAAVTNDGAAVRGVRLNEESVVWLDRGARIGVRLAEHEREIDVRQGRVRIVPSSDPRPLVVTARGARIVPGRTRFDVMTNGDRVIVGAIDGSLTITSASPGNEQAEIRVPGGRALVLENGASRAAAIDRDWPVSRLWFDNVPLARIVRLANQQDGPDLVAGDATVASLRVTGVFDLRDTSRLARKLAATLDLQVSEMSGRLVLNR